MSFSDFEQHLRRQTVRTIPGAWRSDILAAAPVHRGRAEDDELPSAPTVVAWLEDRFWSWRLAWAAMACAMAAACMISAGTMMIHLTHAGTTTLRTESSVTAVDAITAAIRARKAMLGLNETENPPPVAVLRKAPGPSSEGRTPVARV